jgi:glycosyltransferase involved in cell wall biosynthesis
VAKADWLCFLDADDELEPEYLEKMMAPGMRFQLRYPSVRYVMEGAAWPAPQVLQKTPLNYGNYMVIGTLVPKQIFMQAGGFRDISGYEDWDLWIRCWMLGCNPTLIKDAIYRVWQRPGSRNAMAAAQARELSREILDYNRRWRHGR